MIGQHSVDCPNEVKLTDFGPTELRQSIDMKQILKENMISLACAGYFFAAKFYCK